MLRHARGTIVIAAVTVLVAATAGIAIASASGTISACVNNNSGEIKIAPANGTCAANETLLTWNQQGPQGMTGATGAQGPQGDTGATGATGANGVSGYVRVALQNVTVQTGGALTAVATNLLPDGTTATLANACGVQCTLTVYCPTGLVPLGGGWAFRTDATAAANKAVLNIARSLPFQQDVADPDFPSFFPAGHGWKLTYNTTNIPSANWPPAISVFATCANVN